MDAYLKLVQSLVQIFDRFAVARIPRAENKQADALAGLASSSNPGLSRVVPVEFIEHPIIGPPVIINLINSPDGDDETDVQTTQDPGQSHYGFDKIWIETILSYITDGNLPAEKWAARKIRTQAARYVLVGGELYKWRFSGPLMTCVEGENARKIMQEVHSGSCGNHSSGRSLAIKIKRHGHYWPTMIKDS
ncbi:hypothetical protein Bca4012_026487 [Brassica carinata]